MSIHVVSWVFRHSEETLGRRLVLLALAEFAHDDGSRAFPSVRTLVERTRMSERMIQYALRGLEEDGAIEKTGKTKAGVNVYRVVMPGGADIAPVSREEGVQSTTEGVQSVAPDPSVEHPPEKQDLAPAARDPIWDELVEQFGPVAEKTNAHAKRNKAVADLKRLGANVDGIEVATNAWPKLFPGAALTDVALATHYPQLVKAGTPASVTNPPCSECGVGGGMHAADCERLRELQSTVWKD